MFSLVDHFAGQFLGWHGYVAEKHGWRPGDLINLMRFCLALRERLKEAISADEFDAICISCIQTSKRTAIGTQLYAFRHPELAVVGAVAVMVRKQSCELSHSKRAVSRRRGCNVRHTSIKQDRRIPAQVIVSLERSAANGLMSFNLAVAVSMLSQSPTCGVARA